jgi:hypothetical protein
MLKKLSKLLAANSSGSWHTQLSSNKKGERKKKEMPYKITVGAPSQPEC